MMSHSGELCVLSIVRHLSLALGVSGGSPAATNSELVLVIFLLPLLLDRAWTIAVGHLRRHVFRIASLAVGAVFFTSAVVALVTNLILPPLP